MRHDMTHVAEGADRVIGGCIEWFHSYETCLISYETWLISYETWHDIWDVTWHMRRDIWDVTWYVRHGVTHFAEGPERVIRGYVVRFQRTKVTRKACVWDMTPWSVTHVCVWHDSLTCEAWLTPWYVVYDVRSDEWVRVRHAWGMTSVSECGMSSEAWLVSQSAGCVRHASWVGVSQSEPWVSHDEWVRVRYEWGMTSDPLV